MALSFLALERDRFAAVSDREAFYNVKIKKYGTVWRAACWDTYIFNPDKVERYRWPELPKRPARPTKKCEWDKLMEAAGDYVPRADNMARAKSKVYDIAFANVWDYFFTATLDAERCDRYDPIALKRHLHGWLSNRVQRDGMRYLGVPERHKDGALHLHFLISADRLRLEDSGTVLVEERKKPVKLDTARRAGYTVKKTVYNWPDWPLGWSTAIPITGASETVAGYMAKYITKGQERIFGKRYLAGGKIVREVPTVYVRWEYDDINAKEYRPVPGRGVKYVTLEGMSDGRDMDV